MKLALPIFNVDATPAIRDLLIMLPGGLASIAAAVLLCMYDKQVNLNIRARDLEEAEIEIKEKFIIFAELIIKDHIDLSHVDDHENNMRGFERYDVNYLYPYLSMFYDIHKEQYAMRLGSIQKQNIRRIYPGKSNQSKVFIDL